MRRSAATPDAGSPRSLPVLALGSVWKTCRRFSTAAVVCGILVIYSFVATMNLLAWFPEYQESSTTDAAGGLGEILQGFHGGEHAKPIKVIPMHVADRLERQKRINTALEKMQTMQNKSSSWAKTAAARKFPFSLHDRTKSPPFAIFYNVYIPPDQGEEGIRKSLEIIREQVGQVGDSYAASFPGKPVTIFYNTIGVLNALNTTHMSHICADHHNILCIHMQHYESGFELLTLQRVYEYCQYNVNANSDYNVDERVVYMHNKGSYHSELGKADRVRRHLTLAVTNEKCLNPPDDSCSACGLNFFTVWSLQFPGNFFSTKCSYVNKLIPPDEFPERLTAVYDLKRQRIKENPLYLEISPNFTGWAEQFGKGRYIATHWVGSHPSLVPCDMTDKGWDAWVWVDRNESDFSWGMIPRPTQKSHQHNKLLGNLFKWYNLYNEAPGDDSWAWRSFPDGVQWKDAVAQFGNRTIEVTLEKERKRTMVLTANNQTEASSRRRRR